MATALETLRRLCLRQALAETVSKTDLAGIDSDLHRFAPRGDLAALASRCVRGEFLFPVPAVLRANPRLLGYYRLVLGYSQKEFYAKARLGVFRCMEEHGVLKGVTDPGLQELCAALCAKASELLHGIGGDRFSADLLEDLSLLTLGAQLRGSHNTKIGQIAGQAVFGLICNIVSHAVTDRSPGRAGLRNSSGRLVLVQLSADPDITVTESVGPDKESKKLAIEVKGGADVSNIWNRLGEAEKSHQTAKKHGFVEFWTVCNVPQLDTAKAREKSPTTTRFYNLRELLSESGAEYEDFQSRILSATGVSAKPA